MMAKVIQRLSLLACALLVVGCVSTSSSVMDQKKDLRKAELTYVQIGYSHIKEGNYQSAKRPFERALEINKNSAGAFMGLAIVYAYEDEPELAEKNFGLAIRYDESPESRFQYAVWRYNVGDYDQAHEEFTQVVVDPTYAKRAQAYDILGLLELRMNKPDEAIKSFRKAITLSRQFASAYLNLSNAYMTIDDPVMAYDAYNGFTNLVRIGLANHSASTLWLGTQLAQLNADRGAVAVLSGQLIEKFPNSKEAEAYKAWKETL